MDLEFKHTNDDVMEEIGIDYNFLKRCNSELSFLKKYRRKKEKQRIYYNDNGLIQLREIKKLSEQGKTLKEINELLGTVPGNQENTPENTSKTNQNKLEIKKRGEGDDFTDKLLDRIDKLTDKLETAYNQSLGDKNELLEEYKKQVAALPSGKSSEQIMYELEEKKKQEVELNKLREEKEKREEKDKKVKNLMAELRKLNGLGKGKRRLEIIYELNSLM